MTTTKLNNKPPETNTAVGSPNPGPNSLGPFPPTGRRRLSLAQFFEKYVVIMALVGLTIGFSVGLPQTFFTAGNAQSILTTQAVLLIVALGLTVVLAAGDLDLSVGGMIGFTAVFNAQLVGGMGLPWWLALLVSLVAAWVVGLINGILIVRINVNPLIMTLAMGTLLDGAAAAISNSATLGYPVTTLTDIVNTPILGIGFPFWFSLVLLAIVWFVMHHLPTGRALYFTGEGIAAARLIGIRVSRVRINALLISATAAWLAGVVLVGQTGAAQTGLGDPYLLPAYACVFLGAAVLTPGRFNPVGTFIGAMLLAVGTNGLQLFGLATWVTQVFSGAILILAVGAAALFGSSKIKKN